MNLSKAYLQNDTRICADYFLSWAFAITERTMLIRFALLVLAESPLEFLPPKFVWCSSILLQPPGPPRWIYLDCQKPFPFLITPKRSVTSQIILNQWSLDWRRNYPNKKLYRHFFNQMRDKLTADQYDCVIPSSMSLLAFQW